MGLTCDLAPQTLRDGRQVLGAEHLAELHERFKKRMERFDAQPRRIRLLAHEYGWRDVKALLDHGCPVADLRRRLEADRIARQWNAA